MYTSDQKYFTGQKTFWQVVVNEGGNVAEIFASVKAWDHEGRAFQAPVRQLTPDEMQHALIDTQSHLEVINEMVRECYETGLASAAKEVSNGVSTETATESEVE